MRKSSIADYGQYSFNVQHAIDVIRDTYGDDVSVIEKKKDLIKFGENHVVGSTGRYTLWYTGKYQANETYVADNVNSIDTVSSSSASDTQVIRVEGHTMSGGDRTFVVQTVTLNGQNKVTLGTPLNRLTRISHNDESPTGLVGEIYGYQDTAITAGKPNDETLIHLTVQAGDNQSNKCSTSLSSTDYWIITEFSAGYKEKSGSNICDVQLEVRRVGGVFKPVAKPVIISTGGNASREFYPLIIIPANSDVRLTARASATGQDIVGDITGYLAQVVSD